MFSTILKRWLLISLMLSIDLYLPTGEAEAERTRQASLAQSAIGAFPWSSPAKLHHALSKEDGTLVIDSDGVNFRSRNGGVVQLPAAGIQTFLLSSHKLIIETYENRRRHLPGMQRYRFDVSLAIPGEVAALMAGQIQRPSQNAVLDPASLGNVIPAHHRTTAGGTNGELHFYDRGISYFSKTGGDSRSWRWADLQTLSRPDPYHLLVFGYRDSYSFDLKQPLSQSLFNRVTDSLDATDITGEVKGSKK